MSEANPPTHRSDDATELEKILRKGQSWLAGNGTVLIYLLAAILAIAAVVIYVNRATPGNAAASHDLLKAQHNNDLTYQDVADAFPESPIGIWTRLRQADDLLQDGVTNMFKDRATALTQLEDAENAYNRLKDRADVEDSVRERALIGLARLAETRCDGTAKTADAAIDAWKKVLEENPESIVKEHAEDRIEKLGTEESKAFYAWFAAQNPKPDDSGLAPDQTPVPSIPDLSNFGKDKKPPADDTKPDETKPDEAKTDEAKTDEAKTDEAKTDEAKTDEETSSESGDEANTENTAPVGGTPDK